VNDPKAVTVRAALEGPTPRYLIEHPVKAIGLALMSTALAVAVPYAIWVLAVAGLGI
jgi:hypothetical protein